MPQEKVEKTPEEIELEARKERTRQKRREAYLRRKETGWQATYYWKTKRAKKEAMDAMKEELRAENRANGVYYLPNAPKKRYFANSGTSRIKDLYQRIHAQNIGS